MLQILNNTDNFLLLNEDPTPKLQIKYNQVITSIEDNDQFDKKEAKNLRTYNATAPRVFGHIKLHKDGEPMRPIVDTNNSIFSKLNIYFQKILTKSFKDIHGYSIKDSFNLINDLKNITLPPNYILVSFDIVNMYPSIPFQLIQNDIHSN